MAANPMTQFDVYRIGPEIKIGTFDISFTNASLFMIVSSLAILLIFNLFINFSAGYMDLYYGLSLLLLIIFILKLYKPRLVSDYLNLHNILRLIIALGVFSIILLAV